MIIAVAHSAVSLMKPLVLLPRMFSSDFPRHQFHYSVRIVVVYNKQQASKKRAQMIRNSGRMNKKLSIGQLNLISRYGLRLKR
jgi:hypothetical protein